MREPLPAPPPGTRKLDFCRRLGGDWRDLADLVDIPAYERARFPAGDEPRAIWDWLERRDRLPELPGLLDRIDRTDLGDRLRPWRHAEPSTPPPRRTPGRIVLAVAVIALLAVGVAAALRAMTRHRDRSTAAPTPSAAPSVAPATSGDPTVLEPPEGVDVPLEASILVRWRPVPGRTLWVLVGVHPERPGTDDWYTGRCYAKNAAPDRFTCDRVRFGQTPQQHGPWDLVIVQVPEHENGNMEQHVGVGYLKPIDTLPISARSRTYQYRR